MKFLSMVSLSRKLALLVMLAVLPALAIFLYSGIEQRQKSIKVAQKQVFQLTSTMAQIQQDITRSTENILATLSLFPAIQAQDTAACSTIFRAVLEQNLNYENITLTAVNGDVLASGKPVTRVNLADRKHIRDALEKKKFVVGEYIILRTVDAVPAFAFAYPVLDKKGNLQAILTTAIKLDNFAHFHDALKLPEGSFVSITDHQGVRLLYYPAQNSTNPVGKSIKAENWELAKSAKEPGTFISTGSDGQRRIFAFEQVRLAAEDSPYLYVWAGMPEGYILGPANGVLIRNLILMLLATMISLIIAWVIGNNTEALIVKLESASHEINTLRGIIPICSYCKNIRNDDGYYEQIEGYIHKHSGADFSHTICPACLENHYPEQFHKIVEEEIA